MDEIFGCVSFRRCLSSVTMGAIIDTASSILALAEHRVTVSAQNLANISTGGYKRRVDFARILAIGQSATEPTPNEAGVTDFSAGKPVDTGNPYDLALTGPGFFVVRGGDALFYTREGQFRRDEEGRLLTAQGLILQAQGGGDLVLRQTALDLAADGTVIEQGEPVARLAIVDFADLKALRRAEGGAFAAPENMAVELERPSVRQGMLEASNVSTGEEMVAMMETLRRAESGQRLVQVYDDLMGRALCTFGQAQP